MLPHTEIRKNKSEERDVTIIAVWLKGGGRAEPIFPNDKKLVWSSLQYFFFFTVPLAKDRIKRRLLNC
jgi:hypothetical protein